MFTASLQIGLMGQTGGLRWINIGNNVNLWLPPSIYLLTKNSMTNSAKLFTIKTTAKQFVILKYNMLETLF